MDTACERRSRRVRAQGAFVTGKSKLYNFGPLTLMRPQSRQRLLDFVSRAEYVERLPYFATPDRIVFFNARRPDGGDWQVEYGQPPDPDRDALLFNLRLFLQNKDDISLARMAELYDDPAISEHWRQEHASERQLLNRRLRQVAAEGPQGVLTFDDVLRMFLFGHLGHRDEDDRHYQLYQRWVPNDAAREILHNTFHTTIIWVAVAVINVSRACREELGRHPGNVARTAPPAI